MKRIALAMLVLGMAIAGGTGAANAASFGVYVGPDHPYWRHHHWRGVYAYEPECHVIVRHHINRFGERVTVRRRICD
jgi:hypothetical protein